MNKRIKKKRFKAITTYAIHSGRRLKTILGWQNQYAKSTFKACQNSRFSIAQVNNTGRYLYMPYYDLMMPGHNRLGSAYIKIGISESIPYRTRFIMRSIDLQSLKANNTEGSRYIFIGGLSTIFGSIQNFIIDLKTNNILDIVWGFFTHDDHFQMCVTNYGKAKTISVSSGGRYSIIYLKNLEDIEMLGEKPEDTHVFLQRTFKENHDPTFQSLIKVLEREMII